MSPGFWLSHHHDDELYRCYRIGGRFVCARCLGTYPVLFAVLAVELGRGPPAQPPSLWLGVGLILPATLDWAWGRLRGGGPGARGLHSLGNLWRSATGALLGLGLGPSLAVHLLRPFPPVLVAQLAVAGATAALVLLAGYLRR